MIGVFSGKINLVCSKYTIVGPGGRAVRGRWIVATAGSSLVQYMDARL